MPYRRAGQDEGLVRAIGVRSLAANAVNLTVGAGIFVLPAIVAGELDPAGAIAYLVCALAMCLVLLCYAESGSRVSRSGGSYAYVETAGGLLRGPLRRPGLHRGILMGTAGVVALYLGLHVVAQGVLGPELARQKDAPLAAAAERVFGNGGRTLLLAGAALSMFGALAGDMLATPRALFAAGRDGFLPRPLGAVHPRFRTPYVAIAVYATLICAFAITGAFRQLASASSAGLLVVYLACALATLELRRRDVRIAETAFRPPGGLLVPLSACAVVVWLLSHTTRTEAYGLGLLLLAATVVYVVGLVSRSTSRRSS